MHSLINSTLHQVIKPKRVTGVWHVVQWYILLEIRSTKFLSESLKGRYQVADVDGWLIFKWNWKNLGIIRVHMNQPSGSIWVTSSSTRTVLHVSYLVSHCTCCCSVLGVPILVWLSTKDESIERSQPDGTSSQPSSLSALLITSTWCCISLSRHRSSSSSLLPLSTLQANHFLIITGFSNLTRLSMTNHI